MARERGNDDRVAAAADAVVFHYFTYGRQEAGNHKSFIRRKEQEQKKNHDLSLLFLLLPPSSSRYNNKHSIALDPTNGCGSDLLLFSSTADGRLSSTSREKEKKLGGKVGRKISHHAVRSYRHTHILSYCCITGEAGFE